MYFRILGRWGFMCTHEAHATRHRPKSNDCGSDVCKGGNDGMYGWGWGPTDKGTVSCVNNLAEPIFPGTYFPPPHATQQIERPSSIAPSLSSVTSSHRSINVPTSNKLRKPHPTNPFTTTSKASNQSIPCHVEVYTRISLPLQPISIFHNCPALRL